MKVQPGDILIVEFPGVRETKRRPAVVLSSATYHAVRPDVIVGLITSQTAAALAPTDCRLRDWAQAGLRRPSAFRSFLVTLPPSAQSMVVGRLLNEDWRSVQACLSKALALPGLSPRTGGC